MKRSSISLQKALNFINISEEEFKESSQGQTVSYEGLVKVYFSGVPRPSILQLLQAGYTFDLSQTANDIGARLELCKQDVKMAVVSQKSQVSLLDLADLVENGATYDDLLVIHEFS